MRYSEPGTEQTRERTHGHGQQCGDCGVEVEESVRGMMEKIQYKQTIKKDIMTNFMPNTLKI